MNYIIFNNIDSRRFDNLVIQELPPISKPSLRYSSTEISGVDGDSIETTGYKAYDKDISIGLRNNNNIDEIFEWLSGSGDLILSNESDKLYKATVISGIDFARLVRFRTAKIKFHIQPYKYSVAEETNINTIDTSTLNSLTVVNNGNTTSKPIIQIEGSGTVNISYNNKEIKFTFDENGKAKFDSEAQDVSWEGKLLNRNMIGEFFEFEKGENEIQWDGTITSWTIQKKSRWL